MFSVKPRKAPVLIDTVALAAAPQVSAAFRDDRAVLMDLRAGRYYGLDPVGARIFELIQIHKSPADIYGIIESEYDAPASELRSDAVRFLTSLVALGLVCQ